MINNIQLIFLCLLTSQLCFGQYWQQEADYTIDVVLDTATHQYAGTQSIAYTNNSPDRLTKLYYHLYFNAFQPGSMMDIRSTTIMDPDKRVGDRISTLTPEEYGWIAVREMMVDGVPCDYEEDGTILVVYLENAIEPGQTAKLDMKYRAQIPLQIRRSGRDNKEGIDYSMAQWYPKLCAYDYDGWHPNPYIGREFYGNWGDFNVNITLPANYIIGGTGKLLNPDEVGQQINGKMIRYVNQEGDKTWKFIAKNVHDYAWGADPHYTHLREQTDNGIQLDYYFQATETNKENWESLHSYMNASIAYMDKRFGEYPYPRYAFIQGGDGGMEYPMATLITGERPISSLVGVSVHEWIHSWYQMMMATDEAQFPWMDEGFTSFGSSEVMNHLRAEGLLDGEVKVNPIENTMLNYTEFTKSGYEEPLTTHADHYNTNYAYGVGSYVKGAVYLKQLEYVIGKEAFDRVLLAYYDKWKFKHPTAKSFLRVAEVESDMVLDWYHDYFVNSTKTIDYSVDTLMKGSSKKEAIIKLSRTGQMPMPIDVVVAYKDGSQEVFTIPLRLMRGQKANDTGIAKHQTLLDWAWTNPTYEIVLPIKIKKITSVQIDPSLRMADVDLLNNIYPRAVIVEELEEEQK